MGVWTESDFGVIFTEVEGKRFGMTEAEDDDGDTVYKLKISGEEFTVRRFTEKHYMIFAKHRDTRMLERNVYVTTYDPEEIIRFCKAIMPLHMACLEAGDPTLGLSDYPSFC